MSVRRATRRLDRWIRWGMRYPDLNVTPGAERAYRQWVRAHNRSARHPIRCRRRHL